MTNEPKSIEEEIDRLFLDFGIIETPASKRLREWLKESYIAKLAEFRDEVKKSIGVFRSEEVVNLWKRGRKVLVVTEDSRLIRYGEQIDAVYNAITGGK